MTSVGVPAGPGAARAAVLRRRVRLVVAAIIAYNVVEAVVAIGAGTVASSTALVSFGLQSCVEVLSAAAIAWQFSAADPETRERVALRTVAVAFFALAGYVAVESVLTLFGRGEPEPSPLGIVVAAVSLGVMPGLSWLERRTGRELGSASVVADSKQTLLCTYLSAVLLAGLVVNGLFGWAWADPLAALVIAGFAVREGIEAWRGDSCCASSRALLTGHGIGADGVSGPEKAGAGSRSEHVPTDRAVRAARGEGQDCGDGCCVPTPSSSATSTRASSTRTSSTRTTSTRAVSRSDGGVRR